MPKEISVILPTYNEKENIAKLIPVVEDVFSQNNIDGEIVVVDDSSPDGTADYAKKLAKKHKNLRVLVRPKKEGLGAALRDGYNSCESDVIFSMDSDLSLDPNDIPRFLKKIAEGYDFVVGARHGNAGSYEIGEKRTVIKKMVSIIGVNLSKLLIGAPVEDFSLNFKAIRRNVWRALDTKEKRYAFHLEMIVQAHSKGYKVTSIPVAFKERIYGQSKTQLSKEVPTFLWKLIGFTWKYRIRKTV